MVELYTTIFRNSPALQIKFIDFIALNPIFISVLQSQGKKVLFNKVKAICKILNAIDIAQRGYLRPFQRNSLRADIQLFSRIKTLSEDRLISLTGQLIRLINVMPQSFYDSPLGRTGWAPIFDVLITLPPDQLIPIVNRTINHMRVAIDGQQLPPGRPEIFNILHDMLQERNPRGLLNPVVILPLEDDELDDERRPTRAPS